jgi:predicted 3-demethylubiquinone-9 3-methyltransferase (glyoxalase superfamily)
MKPRIHTCLWFDTQAEEAARFYTALSAVPEAEMCGWLVDRWGVSWQIVPQRFMERMEEPPSPARQRMTVAIRQMRKLDIAALERAYAGTP